MLTMALSADAVEIMTFYNPLESFSFGSTDDIDHFAFGENVYCQRVSQVFLQREIAEFPDKLFGGGI